MGALQDWVCHHRAEKAPPLFFSSCCQEQEVKSFASCSFPQNYPRREHRCFFLFSLAQLKMNKILKPDRQPRTIYNPKNHLVQSTAEAYSHCEGKLSPRFSICGRQTLRYYNTDDQAIHVCIETYRNDSRCV